MSATDDDQQRDEDDERAARERRERREERRRRKERTRREGLRRRLGDSSAFKRETLSLIHISTPPSAPSTTSRPAKARSSACGSRATV